MSTSVQQVREFLNLLGLKYDKPEEFENLFLIFFTTRKYLYKTSDGDKQRVAIGIEVDESGELLTFAAPQIYQCPNDANKNNKLALFQTLLEIQYKYKLVRFTYDPSDGYIVLKVSIPLEDTPLTPRMLNRCLKIIPECLDEYHTDIVEALNEGLLPESDESKRKALEEFQKLRRQQRREQFGD
jgi:hypothetical protein